MLMSVVSSAELAEIHPELAGARVLVTGLTAEAGVDIVRAFADHRARLVLQTPGETPEINELAAVVAQSAAEIRLYAEPLEPGEGAVRFAQTAALAYAGLDAAINIITLAPEDLAGLASTADIERLVSLKLGAALEITRVVANRMRLTLGTGLVLNVVVAPAVRTVAEATLVGVVRATLAAMTRREAEAWAEQAIRINAIAPRVPLPGEKPAGAMLSSEADMAALALRLASKAGRNLTGHVFDAESVAARGC